MGRIKFKGLIAGVVFLLLGVATIGYSVYASYISVESENWPSAEGTVIKSEIYSYTEQDSAGDQDSFPTYTTYYEPKIQYLYSVEGIQYTGNKISIIKDKFVIENEAQQVIDKYSIGKNVSVFYNPNNPSDALLETGLKDTFIIIISLIIGIIVTIVSFLIILGSIKRRRQNEEN